MRARRMVAVVTALLVLASACTDDDSDPPEGSRDRTAYVALGDSFSTGGGAPPYDGPCARSELGWPYVVEEESDLVDSVDLRACGGATIELLMGTGPRGPSTTQIPEDPDEDVTLVTLTIGGNDAAAITTIAACAAVDCAPVAGSAQYQTELAQITAGLADEVYPALRTAYPNARLVQVGYPRLTPPADETVQDCPWLVGANRTAPADILEALNGALEAATAEVPRLNVEFVDITDALARHELCTFAPWVHRVSDGIEALHPTADGYEAIGKAIATALGI